MSNHAPNTGQPSGRTRGIASSVKNLLGRVGAAFNEAAAIGGLASDLAAAGGSTTIDVASNKKYKWTLSNVDVSEVPYIELIEYTYNDTQLKLAFNNFIENFTGTAKNIAQVVSSPAQTDSMAMYQSLYPKDKPTGFTYKFPYFNKTGFELASPDWQQIEGMGDKLNSFIGSISETAAKIANLAGEAAKMAVAAQNQSVGAVDRPKIFMSHADRSIAISFILLNTIGPEDWQTNKALGYLLMNQNLFNKKDYVTGSPPVIYEVHIPGQYYCYAAAMTNIRMDHLGNQRLLDGNIVPDAYQFELTLTELVKPSRNQLEALNNGYAQSRVTTKKG